MSYNFAIPHDPPMPRPAHLWRHVIINTHSSWLHGDPRGFRSRHHRIHSSGDYRNPPPEGEHANLHAHHLRQSRACVEIPKSLRPVVGQAFIRAFLDQGCKILAVSVAKHHAHALAELPRDRDRVRTIVGEAKRRSSRTIRQALPGNLWASGGMFKPVLNRAHARKVFEYIVYEQESGAWTWSFRDKTLGGMFDRRRIRAGATVATAPSALARRE